jgi:hypothetical protein
MNTPRMKEAWAKSSRTADGFYSSATPMSKYAFSCYDEGCILERELTAVTEQRDRLAEALQKVLKSWDDETWLDGNEFESFREALQSLTPNEL